MTGGDYLFTPLEEFVSLPLTDQEAQFHYLTAGQRAICSVWALAAAVMAEGLHGFLWNSTGYMANDAVVGARLLGLDAYASALAPVVQAFPGGTVPADSYERRCFLETVAGTATEAAFQLADDELTELTNAYPDDLQRHAEQIIRSRSDDFFVDHSEPVGP